MRNRIARAVLVLSAAILACRRPETASPPTPTAPAREAPAPTPVSAPALAPAPTATPVPAASSAYFPALRPGGDVSQPRLLSNPSPAVPGRCFPMSIQGPGRSFVFELSVSDRGLVRAVRTLASPAFFPPCPEFEELWHQAIRQWRYAPALRDGRAVAVTTSVSIDLKE